jgi:hypothetical protein
MGSWDCLDFPERPNFPLTGGKWRGGGGGVELPCSQVATVHRLLQETLAMVGQDVLQPPRVSPKKLPRLTFAGSSFSS